jgi:hypothetical protein
MSTLSSQFLFKLFAAVSWSTITPEATSGPCEAMRAIAGIERHHEWSAQPRARTHWVKSMVKSRHIADCHADCSASGHVPLERDTKLKKQVKKTKKY